jgi:hypothetical protein
VELHPPTVPEADWWLHVGFIAEAEGERWRCIVRELLEAEGQAEVFRHVELGAVDCVVQPL